MFSTTYEGGNKHISHFYRTDSERYTYDPLYNHDTIDFLLNLQE